MKRVIVESPFAGDVERNLRYVRACMRDCLKRGEAPFASHALYTQPGVLRDDVPDERALGIEAGFEWRAGSDCTVFYIDCGFSSGMRKGLVHALEFNYPVEFRTLGAGWGTETQVPSGGQLGLCGSVTSDGLHLGSAQNCGNVELSLSPGQAASGEPTSGESK